MLLAFWVLHLFVIAHKQLKMNLLTKQMRPFYQTRLFYQEKRKAYRNSLFLSENGKTIQEKGKTFRKSQKLTRKSKTIQEWPVPYRKPEKFEGNLKTLQENQKP
jgi:hypothetical protein